LSSLNGPAVLNYLFFCAVTHLQHTAPKGRSVIIQILWANYVQGVYDAWQIAFGNDSCPCRSP